MSDKRDPKLLGEKLLGFRPMRKYAGHGLSVVADGIEMHMYPVPDYRDETTIEKYGDPRLLPSTLPN